MYIFSSLLLHAINTHKPKIWKCLHSIKWIFHFLNFFEKCLHSVKHLEYGLPPTFSNEKLIVTVENLSLLKGFVIKSGCCNRIIPDLTR